MISKILSRCISKKNPAQQHRQIGMIASIFNIIMNVLLSILKIIIGAFSANISILADGFNNIADCAASSVTLTSFFLSTKKPDRKHPFGYGRIEYIAGTLVSVLILYFALNLIKSSIESIIYPKEQIFSWISLILMIGAIAAKLLSWYVNIKIAKQINNSAALKATAFDSLTDVFATSIAVLSLVLNKLLPFSVDGYLGLIISVIITIGGLKILNTTLSPLLGPPANASLAQQIKEKALSYQEIIGIHDLIIHNYGPMKMIATFHAEIPASHNLLYAHEVIDKAEREIAEAFNITVLIHLDPIVTDNQRINEVKRQVEACLKKLHPAYDMHDFRMRDGQNQVNLIFDVLVPYDVKLDHTEIENQIQSSVKMIDEKYHCIITIDNSFIE